jgi:PadR family transcriptional regulator, regulatory protein PadR
MKLSKELVGASAAPLVLAILEDGESYGYAIIERVKALSDGEIEWTDGMLYPVLHRLEEQGWVRASWGQSDAGRKRKYYTLTAAGKKALAAHKSQWELVHKTLAQAWGLGHA